MNLRNQLSKLKKYIFYVFFFFFCLLETIANLVRFFLVFKKEKAQKLSVRWHWSFGHQVCSIDSLSRIFYPNKIIIIEILHPRSNPYLAEFYENVTSFRIKPFLFKNSHYYSELIYRLCLIFFKIKEVFSQSVSLVDERIGYEILGDIAGEKFKQYDEKNSRLIKYLNLTPFLNQMTKKIGTNPRVPLKYLKQIKPKIEEVAYNRKIAVLHLRRARTKTHYDLNRDCGDQARYIPLVSQLIDSGFVVFSQGETDSAIFQKNKYFFDSDNLDIDKKILNLYLLNTADIYITQHSGACVFANSSRTPMLVTDSFPFYIGTYNSNDTILMKNIFINGKHLPINEIFNSYEDIFLGKLDIKGLEIKENTPEQICDAFLGKSVSKQSYSFDSPIKLEGNNICHSTSGLKK